jgi:hypothetical protein
MVDLFSHLSWSLIRNVASWIGKASMTLRGIEFFANEYELHREDLDRKLSNVKTTVDGIFIIGRTLREGKYNNIRKFHRIILPNPEFESILYYAETVNETRDEIKRDISLLLLNTSNP